MTEKITPNIHRLSRPEADVLAGKTDPGPGSEVENTVAGPNDKTGDDIPTPEEVSELRESLKNANPENDGDVFENTENPK